MPELMESPTALRPIARDDVDGIVRGVEQDGFAFMPGVIDRATTAEACRAIDALTPIPHDVQAADGAAIDHYKCVFNRDPYWLRFIDQAGIIDALERLLGPACHIIGMSAWRTPPTKGCD